MKLAALLLDIDGTLLDTREFILSAFEHTISLLGGVAPSREEIAQEVGRPLEDIYREILGSGRESPAVAAHRDFQSTNLALVAAFPGAATALASVRERGIRLAGVTSRSERTAIPSLELAGLAAYFQTVVAAEDTVALKPDPAPLRLALERMGVGPQAALMVGDTSHDILAGRVLGMRTLAATYGFQGKNVLAAQPDGVLNSISELPEAVRALGPGQGRLRYDATTD
ncbi:MAG TPA: HAD-IA family hydrolase [Dehalococcoidia bacterium]|jgi:pyrophosphatase PpaX|nr:HAD-IA family hydrolase [Dehalococcoidia bacterium]